MKIRSVKKSKPLLVSRALLSLSLQFSIFVKSYFKTKVESRLARLNKSLIFAALAGTVIAHVLFMLIFNEKFQDITYPFEDRPLPANVLRNIILSCSNGVIKYDKNTSVYSLSGLKIEIHNESSSLIKIRGDGQAYRDGKSKEPLHIWPSTWSKESGYGGGIVGLYPLEGIIGLMPGEKHIGVQEIKDLRLDPSKITSDGFFVEYRFVNAGNWQKASPPCRVNIPQVVIK